MLCFYFLTESRHSNFIWPQIVVSDVLYCDMDLYKYHMMCFHSMLFFYILCLYCHVSLHMQILRLRPAEYKSSRLFRNGNTVNRAYGGVLSGGAVRERSVVI